jgi:thiol-disulfide isomerase/thioredoxin
MISLVVLRMKLSRPVAYLEDSDFDQQGNLLHKGLAVVMIQASFCGYCNMAKPAFQEFANKTKGKVFCATIHGDSNKPSVKALMARIKTIKPDFRGYPDYILYMNGKRLDKQIGGRDLGDLYRFANL